MPVFRVTKNLATALKLHLTKDVDVHGDQDHEWFADLFYVEGKKAVIWVHHATLLTFVRPGVTAAELREFHALFRREFRTLLASLALPESLTDQFGLHKEDTYASTNDRRIVGSMLDYRKMFQHFIAYDGGRAAADVVQINADLNNTPMSVLGGDAAVRRARSLAAVDETLR